MYASYTYLVHTYVYWYHARSQGRTEQNANEADGEVHDFVKTEDLQINAESSMLQDNSPGAANSVCLLTLSHSDRRVLALRLRAD